MNEFNIVKLKQFCSMLSLGVLSSPLSSEWKKLCCNGVLPLYREQPINSVGNFKGGVLQIFVVSFLLQVVTVFLMH